ncbi:MAG: autotransporter outer membrane beta-barrel domain-containing protein [Acidimicrobiales bacterium]
MFSKRKFTFGSLAVAAAVAALGLSSATQGATYTYTPSNTTTDLWSAGTNWSAIPVSGASTTLTFGANSPALANGLTNTNTDDISGGFQANVINLQGTGPASGAATINIAAGSGAYLNMVNNGTADPIINLNANAGTAGLTYNVTAPITYASSGSYKRLELLGIGNAAFNFSGGITTSTTNGFLENSKSTVTLSGSATNTFTGGFGTASATNAVLNINANVVANGTGGVGGLNLQSGTFTQGNNATVNVGTVGSLTSYAGSAIIGLGATGDQGTYTLNSGTLNINVSSAGLGLLVGYASGTSAILNVNGGTLNNYAEVAATSSTSATDALTTLYVAPRGTGTVNQTGGTVNTGPVQLGASGTTGTYNLSGGTLATDLVDTAAGTSVFNFNGGTLQANAATPGIAPNYGRFMKGLTSANVQSGGAIIDSNGQTLWFAQALLHSSSLGSTLDGGLTKNGAGTLDLTQPNTYTGATTVAGGTLALGVLVNTANGIGSLG